MIIMDLFFPPLLPLSSPLFPFTFPSPPLFSTSNLWVTITVILKAFQKHLSLSLSPCIPWSSWSMGVNQSLAFTQIGNKYHRAHETIMTGLRWKWIPALTLHTALLFSRPTGSCHGKQLSLVASWQPRTIASAISPHPQAFSRQIASSTLKSNLLPTIGFYQRNRWFPLFPWTMQWELSGYRGGTIKRCFDLDFASAQTAPSPQCPTLREAFCSGGGGEEEEEVEGGCSTAPRPRLMKAGRQKGGQVRDRV